MAGASVKDRVALEDLLVRYTQAIDFEDDPEAIITLFTSDAVLVGPYWGPYQGEEQIRAWAQTTVTMRNDTKMRHYLSNFLVDVDGDTARIRAYLVAVYRRPVMETIDATQALYGDYDCEARRTSDGWKLSKRVVHLDVAHAGVQRDQR